MRFDFADSSAWGWLRFERAPGGHVSRVRMWVGDDEDHFMVYDAEFFAGLVAALRAVAPEAFE